MEVVPVVPVVQVVQVVQVVPVEQVVQVVPVCCPGMSYRVVHSTVALVRCSPALRSLGRPLGPWDWP